VTAPGLLRGHYKLAVQSSVQPSSPLSVKTNMNTCLQITIPGDVSKISVVGPPQHGIVGTSPSGSPPNIVTYAPDAGFTGADSFTYKTTDSKGVDSTSAKVIITVNLRVPRSAHVLWVLVSISLIAALYFAYVDTTSKSTLDMLLPKTNITINTQNINSTPTTTVTKSTHTATLSVPQIPRFIIIWGYIGAAAYLLKVVTAYLGENKYEGSYLPFHIARLFIGPALAVLIYFILQTGSFFGLSFDITKVPPTLLPYLYAGVAFLTGYFVRQIIETLSKITNAIFNIKQSSPHTATTS
jgi:hypothetical protein